MAAWEEVPSQRVDLFKPAALCNGPLEVKNRTFEDTLSYSGRLQNIELFFGSEIYGVGKYAGNIPSTYHVSFK